MSRVCRYGQHDGERVSNGRDVVAETCAVNARSLSLPQAPPRRTSRATSHSRARSQAPCGSHRAMGTTNGTGAALALHCARQTPHWRWWYRYRPGSSVHHFWDTAVRRSAPDVLPAIREHSWASTGASKAPVDSGGGVAWRCGCVCAAADEGLADGGGGVERRGDGGTVRWLVVVSTGTLRWPSFGVRWCRCVGSAELLGCRSESQTSNGANG